PPQDSHMPTRWHVGLLCQIGNIPYCDCPPPGSGIGAATGTADLTVTATGSSIDNRCGEHGLDSMSPTSPGIWPKLSQRELKTSLAKDISSRPPPCAWACKVCLAFSSSSGSNSPPGGDQWTAQPVSSVKRLG
ncbi:hypothetical protein ILYODFUR_030818, partial [Ilyodon furcidens]